MNPPRPTASNIHNGKIRMVASKQVPRQNCLVLGNAGINFVAHEINLGGRALGADQEYEA